jgi:DNA methylase
MRRLRLAPPGLASIPCSSAALVWRGARVFSGAVAVFVVVPARSRVSGYRTNVRTYRGVNTMAKGRMAELQLHPTVKPVQMIADAIKDVSARGEIVLDSFGGSGSTLIAAEKAGRRARLVELDPIYCDRILTRRETIARDDAAQILGGWPRATDAAVAGLAAAE